MGIGCSCTDRDGKEKPKETNTFIDRKIEIRDHYGLHIVGDSLLTAINNLPKFKPTSLRLNENEGSPHSILYVVLLNKEGTK